MNNMLRYAQKEVQRLKHKQNERDGEIVELILDFSRKENEITNLVGYKYFEETLALLPLPHNEDSIKKACELSHFNYEYFLEDFITDMDNITIPIKCTKEQARILNYRNKGDYNL